MMSAGRWTWFRAAEVGILVAFTLSRRVRNALVFPAIAGIDASEHVTYARELVMNGRLGTSSSYYTPPGWYAIAGELLRFGDWLDLEQREHPAQLLSALLTVASAVVVLGVVERVFPQRPWLRLWALAGFCACPAVFKPAAMVHPQSLVLFLTAVALYALLRILDQRRWSVLAAVGLGLALGAAQLVRSVGLWIYVAAAVTFVVALILKRADRRRVALVAAVALAIGIVVPLPWYVYLQVEYGDPLFGGRPEVTVGASAGGHVLRRGLGEATGHGGQSLGDRPLAQGRDASRSVPLRNRPLDIGGNRDRSPSTRAASAPGAPLVLHRDGVARVDHAAVSRCARAGVRAGRLR